MTITCFGGNHQPTPSEQPLQTNPDSTYRLSLTPTGALMRRITLLTAALLLAVAPIASAKPTTVKGAKCTVCHEAMPPKKDNLNKKAAAMLVTHKTEASCKECHSWVDGKMTSKKK
jgi:hypothetical protein